MIRHLVILGATGDLTARFLLPALARLFQAGKLDASTRITAVARQALTGAAYRDHARAALGTHARDLPADVAAKLCERIAFRAADAKEAGAVERALAPLTGPVLTYLALPPAAFAPAVAALAGAGLPADSRIVVEKPFGTDLASAIELNGVLRRSFRESSVFRMDHFMGKQAVLNLLGLRFANSLFEPLWNARHIARVDITSDEVLGLEGRAGYYDRTGALRDMVQNHLLTLLCLLAMEVPRSIGERDLRDRRVEVLRSVRRLSRDEVARQTMRARYAASASGPALPAYADEPGVDPARGTETYAAVVLYVDNWRWSGVPFVLRTGKALREQHKEIAVTFCQVPHLVFGAPAPPVNRLRIELAPERVALGLNINGPREPFDLERVDIETTIPPHPLPAYARLLLDALEGDQTLSLRNDEVEEAWRVVEPILDRWRDGASPLREYPAGSDGPPHKSMVPGL